MATGMLRIDLSAIVANWRALDAMSGPGVETGAVVKADAYGLGAIPVAGALADAGVATFFVAVAEEARALRRAVGTKPRIFVFGGHQSGDTATLLETGAIPLLNSPEQVWRHLGTGGGRAFGIQLDTGMNRLGLEPGDWEALRGEAMEAGPELVISHLACADEPRHPMNARQLAVFRELTDALPVPRSLAATGGTLLGPEYHFDLVRPGIGLYGGMPFAAATPVVRLDVPVVQTRRVAAGETVGYGNAWTAPGDRVIATISAGYADGILRAAGAGARAFADGRPCPVVGRVSMDLITVDVTGLDPVPEALTLLGPGQGVDDLAGAAGTIGYEILTALGPRYARAYVEEPHRPGG